MSTSAIDRPQAALTNSPPTPGAMETEVVSWQQAHANAMREAADVMRSIEMLAKEIEQSAATVYTAALAKEIIANVETWRTKKAR